MRLIDADALIAYCNDNWIPLNVDAVNAQPTIQSELTDEQSIAYLQSSGWMQRHDKEMYERGLKEQLADDSDSYDSLLPTVQPERKPGHWLINSDGYYPYFSECKSEPKSGDMTDFCPSCGADMRGSNP